MLNHDGKGCPKNEKFDPAKDWMPGKIVPNLPYRQDIEALQL
jgi:hypothetical protein